MDWAFAAATVAVLVHSQIEMTFFQPGAVVWGWCCLGLVVASQGAPAGNRAPRVGLLAATLLLALAIWVAASGAAPASAQQRHLTAAAEVLRPLAEATSWLALALREPDPGLRREAIDRIDGALRELGASADEIDVAGFGATAASTGFLTANARVRLEQLLLYFEPDRRTAAADELVRAYESMPTSTIPLLAAAEQLKDAAGADIGADPRERTLRARELAGRAIDQHGAPSAMRLAAQLDKQLAVITGEESYRRSALDLAMRIAAIDPQGNGSWALVGDCAIRCGETERAVDAYRKALEADDNFELDPLKRLRAEKRRSIERYLKKKGSGFGVQGAGGPAADSLPEP